MCKFKNWSNYQQKAKYNKFGCNQIRILNEFKTQKYFSLKF